MKKKNEFNPERMTRGIPREDFKRLQMADAKPIMDEDSDSMEDDEVVVIDPGNAGGRQKDQMLK